MQHTTFKARFQMYKYVLYRLHFVCDLQRFHIVCTVYHAQFAAETSCGVVLDSCRPTSHSKRSRRQLATSAADK